MFEGMKCFDIDEHFSNEVYGQFVLKAQDVSEECNWDLAFKNEANGNFLTFNMKIVPLDMVRGELFEAQNFEMNSEHKVHLTADSMITFRQYSDNGVFPFSSDYSSIYADSKCAYIRDQYQNEKLAQVIFRGGWNVSECTKTVTFKSTDEQNFLTFHLIVAPNESMLGQIFYAHNFEMNSVQDVTMRGNQAITFRQ
jgi:hypothetical protein